MRTSLGLLLVASLLLSACSGWRDSRVNPSNWFGGGSSKRTPVATEANPNPLIPEQTSIFRRDQREIYEGTLVAEVTALTLEPTSTGAIVRVTGVTARQGAYDVRLVNETDGDPVDGVLKFELKALQPTNQGIGGTNARTIRTGVYVSSEVLERTSAVEVVGLRNTRTSRPR